MPRKKAGADEAADTPTPPRGRGRQTKIPGSTPADIAELDDIADELAEAHDAQMEARNKTIGLRARMLEAMRKHDRTLYERGGVRFERVEGDEKLKLKMLKEDED